MHQFPINSSSAKQSYDFKENNINAETNFSK